MAINTLPVFGQQLAQVHTRRQWGVFPELGD